MRCSFVALALAIVGCDKDPDPIRADDTGTGTDTGDANAPWIEIGWGDGEWNELADGGEFPIELGGQGLFMFAMPLRGGNFTLPDDPKDYADEKAPKVDVEMDIPGFNNDVDDHFRRIANYPIPFDVYDDGMYEFLSVWIILPDDVAPADIDALPGELWVRLRPYEMDPIIVERSFVVQAAAP